MLRTLHASTIEFDDPEAAVEDILDQINLENLDENTIGIVTFPRVSLDAGVMEALSTALPFDTIGCTTIMNDLCGQADEDQIALMILTGDDVFFSCGVSSALSSNYEDAIAEMYKNTASTLEGAPAVGITFAPLLLDISADRMVRALDETAKSLPIFGTVALDYTDIIGKPQTYLNGNFYDNCMTFLLIGGNIKPQFFFAAIPENRFLKQKAVITAAEGNILKEVNGIKARTYLQSLGIIDEGKIESIPSVPLSIDVGDGSTPVARSIMGSTDEDDIICGGDMPVDAMLGVGFIDMNDVQNTAGKVAEQIVQSGAQNGALIISCLSRLVALDVNPMLETERINSVLDERIPHLLLYSAGELYPEIIDNRTYNKAHNGTIIACAF